MICFEFVCLLINSELCDKLKYYLLKINIIFVFYECILYILIIWVVWIIDNGMLILILKYYWKIIESCFKLDVLKCCENKEEVIFV